MCEGGPHAPPVGPRGLGGAPPLRPPLEPMCLLVPSPSRPAPSSRASARRGAFAPRPRRLSGNPRGRPPGAPRAPARRTPPPPQACASMGLLRLLKLSTRRRICPHPRWIGSLTQNVLPHPRRGRAAATRPAQPARAGRPRPPSCPSPKKRSRESSCSTTLELSTREPPATAAQARTRNRMLEHGTDSGRARSHALYPLDGAADQPNLMARSLAYLFAAGGLITLVLFLLLPHPEAGTAGMLSVAIAALVFGVAIEACAERIPAGAYPWIVACGNLLVTGAVYFRGSPTTAHALFYLWVTFYSFYFFRRGTALLQLVLCGAGYALALAALTEPPRHSFELWSITLCTLVVAGILITSLQRRIEDIVVRHASAGPAHGIDAVLDRRGFEDTFELELERA